MFATIKVKKSSTSTGTLSEEISILQAINPHKGQIKLLEIP